MRLSFDACMRLRAPPGDYLEGRLALRAPSDNDNGGRTWTTSLAVRPSVITRE
jgi:hypothetical protein